MKRKREILYFFNINTCYKCGRDAIELYNQYGKPMNYSDMIIRRNRGEPLNIKNNICISSCKCKVCGKTYGIMYDHKDNFPLPITFPEFHQDLFINQFINLGIAREKSIYDKDKKKGNL